VAVVVMPFAVYVLVSEAQSFTGHYFIWKLWLVTYHHYSTAFVACLLSGLH
jgi:hypothetical protein